ncbi:MAG: OmpA family protein [Cryobacterium sp.]|nr:OmpA family protein [Oligoflexia bacterium]
MSAKNSVLMGVLASLLLASGCASDQKRTAMGAGGGAVGGAAIGALLGGGKGAAIGAGLGAVAGGVVGNRLDKQAKELAQVADTKRTQDGILVNLKNDLLFETGSAKLQAAAIPQLEQLSGVLVKYPANRILVAGHTDSIGNPTFNEGLSLQRAKAVQNVLLEKGVPADQIRTEGYGESKPIDSNSSKSGRQKNRRVELVITDNGAKTS